MSTPLPEPGVIVQHDFRTGRPSAQPRGQTLRVVQFNIERGYELDNIIEELSRADADVIALQEIDVGCERSGGVDTGVAIAKALRMNYAFVAEFAEIHSPLRSPELQGILTPYDFVNERHGELLNEPRIGRRETIVATVDTPQGFVTVYSIHLEVFCGILDRVHDFSEVLQDARERMAAAKQRGDASDPVMLMCGDLNTMSHGIARLSPKSDEDGPVNERLRGFGLPVHVLRQARNPGFQYVFHKDTETLSSYHGLYKGKLDWILGSRTQVVDTQVCNADYTASDHRMLVASLNIVPSKSRIYP